jgi:hypothetical protein
MHEAKLVSKKILPMLLNGPKPPIVVHLSRWNDYLTIEYFLCHLEGTPLTIEPGIHMLFVWVRPTQYLVGRTAKRVVGMGEWKP